MQRLIRCDWCDYDDFGSIEPGTLDGHPVLVYHCLRCRRGMFVYKGRIEEEEDKEEEIQDDFCAIPKITDT